MLSFKTAEVHHLIKAFDEYSRNQYFKDLNSGFLQGLRKHKVFLLN